MTRKPWYGFICFAMVTVFRTLGLHAGEGLPDSLEKQVNPLTVGSPAPTLAIQHWIGQGTDGSHEVHRFEKNNIYVIEFWATWCQPCLSSMPSLANLQKRYASHGLQIVSVSDEPIDKVKAFLKTPVPERIWTAATEAGLQVTKASRPATYGDLTRVYSLTTDPDRSTHEDYVKAAAQNGIPVSFLVGKTGLIEWIGHPMSLEQPLQAVLNDTWDRDAFAVAFQQKQALDRAVREASALVRRNEYDAALNLIQEAQQSDINRVARLADVYFEKYYQQKLDYLTEIGKADVALKDVEARLRAADDSTTTFLKSRQLALLFELERDRDVIKTLASFLPRTGYDADAADLNKVAWEMYERLRDRTSASSPANPSVLAKAIEVAEAAVAKAPRQPESLDTLAHLVYLSGNVPQAFEIQSQAMQMSSRINPNIQAFHQELKAELADD